MGWLEERVGIDGQTHYLARYRDLKGRKLSAGTFTSERKANKAWQAAEAEVAKGHAGNLARGRMTFKRYVEETWLPNHEVEPTTMQSYHYSISR